MCCIALLTCVLMLVPCNHNRYSTAIETGQASFKTTATTSTVATSSSSIDSVADAKHFGTTSDADIEFKQLIWSLLSDLASNSEECHGTDMLM
jgi:hypothetical protein